MNELLIKEAIIRLINQRAIIQDSHLLEKNYDLVNDLGIDSFNFMELIVDIEEEFDIKFSYSQLNIEFLKFSNNLIECIIDLINNCN